MTIVLPSNFQDWYQEWRQATPHHPLRRTEGSCVMPNRKFVDMLREAYQAGVSVAMEAATKQSSN